ncbi:MAG TPA: hypothetical protein VN577_03390 [Terriglobales bacterium]|nr:hypothetical protein [Terriglobales bacterium]
MKKLLLVAVVLFTTAAFCSTWSNVTLVDTMCAKKVAANPDAHARDCAMGCGGKSGFGIVTSDQKFLKFDDSGNQQAMALLKSSDKKDHLRVTVDGEEKDGTIQVKSVKFD